MSAERNKISWAVLLACVTSSVLSAAVVSFLNFVPLEAGRLSEFRMFLNLPSPFFALFDIILLANAIIITLKAIWKKQLWRALTCVAGILLMPSIFILILRVNIFNPYYWYVFINQSRFERVVRAASRPGLPAFVRLEERDVSVGLAITPPTFASIFYDESDEFGLDPLTRSSQWKAENDKILAGYTADPFPTYAVHRLYGHFFLAYSSYQGQLVLSDFEYQAEFKYAASDGEQDHAGYAAAWKRMAAVAAQQALNLANQGKAVIVGLASRNHGHVVVVMPGEMQHAGDYMANGRMLPTSKNFLPAVHVWLAWIVARCEDQGGEDRKRRLGQC